MYLLFKYQEIGENIAFGGHKIYFLMSGKRLIARNYGIKEVV